MPILRFSTAYPYSLMHLNPGSPYHAPFQNFEFGPPFGNMALKPQNGPKFENRTPPSVLELGLCNFQNILT